MPPPPSHGTAPRTSPRTAAVTCGRARSRRARRPRRCGRHRRRAPSPADTCGAGAARAAPTPPSSRRTSPRGWRSSPPTAWPRRRCRRCRRTGRARARHPPVPVSPAIAASTRGSSWATSATTSSQPGSARTASRSCRGSWSAPPPDDAQRPVTTPPGTYTGRNRPSCTHSASHVQPFADCRRESFLYSSSGSMTGCCCSASSHRLVDSTSTPAR